MSIKILDDIINVQKKKVFMKRKKPIYIEEKIPVFKFDSPWRFRKANIKKFTNRSPAK